MRGPMRGPAPRLDAVAARLRAAGCVYAEDEARLLLEAAASPDELAARVARRCAGAPLEQLLGWAEFCGLRVRVAPGVFVPRARTALLVSEAVRVVRSLATVRDLRVASGGDPRPERHELSDPRPVVVDLCCGTGAVGRAVLAGLAHPGVDPVELHAADVDPAATACAADNLGDRARVHTGDLLDALPGRLRGRVDVLVANAPYVPTGRIAAMPPEARDHEPRTALDGGDDGVALHRRIAAAAPDWLARGGALLLETGRAQAGLTAAAVAAVGLRPEVVTDDDLDATVVVGRRP
ncbi:putative protein N(5)-glutamine methyltransferase [Nocardioides sp. GCM10027113]|uniref:putative protein N(5)-glutamine methyltransferase n=1 Tax=unclassified Nocardioides TaxID=2615069 RepID=UPI00361D71E5